MVIAFNEVHTFVFFIYEEINWFASPASFLLRSSVTGFNIIDDAFAAYVMGSNIDIPGVYLFNVDGTALILPTGIVDLTM